MSQSEDKPPTLASLRARRGKSRSERGARGDVSGRDPYGQHGLFSDAETDSAFDDLQRRIVGTNRQGVATTPSPGFQAHIVPALTAAPERRIWSVGALVADMRHHVELAYADLWVEGEI